MDYRIGASAARVKLGFGFAGLSPRHTQQLIHAGTGAAGGALLAGEGNRMTGAMGGAGLGLSLGHVPKPARMGRMRPKPGAVGEVVEAAGKNMPTTPVNRSSAEYLPGGMKPIQKTQFHPAEAGASVPPPGFASNSLPPGAGPSMPPSAYVSGHSLPPSANAELPAAMAMRPETTARPVPVAAPMIPPPPRVPSNLTPLAAPHANRMSPAEYRDLDSMLAKPMPAPSNYSVAMSEPPRPDTRFISPSLLGSLVGGR